MYKKFTCYYLSQPELPNQVEILHEDAQPHRPVLAHLLMNFQIFELQKRLFLLRHGKINAGCALFALKISSIENHSIFTAIIKSFA